MNETEKANLRRRDDPLFHKALRGHGIDIGCGDDKLDNGRWFPIESCIGFDIKNGFDAEKIDQYYDPESFDFVYSSHCLEHLELPYSALTKWFNLVRPNGYLMFVVPDEDLYEQGTWPSRFNEEHIWTFTIDKLKSWSPASINLARMIPIALAEQPHQIVRIELIDTYYDYSLDGIDQSLGDAEVSIEVIVRKLEH